MSWIEKLLPPRIQRNDGAQRRMPEGLWVKCPSCEAVLYKTDLEQNCMVCPKCDHHMRIGCARRGSTRFSTARAASRSGATRCRSITLKFKDSKKYPDRLKEAMESTGETDALVVMGGAIHTVPVVAAVFEFGFMGGSMGSVVGERFARGVQTLAIEQKVPFICFTATGGARMQEGLLSLMQMAKTTGMLTKLSPGEAAVHQRADRSHHGRRVGQLRVHGRRRDRPSPTR